MRASYPVLSVGIPLLVVSASGCSETLTETQIVERVDTVHVTDTLLVGPNQYRIDTVATGFNRPVTVQADAQA